MRLFNRHRHTELRRQLRTHGTTAEAALWTQLKNRQLGGLRWRRQFGVGPYVLDFYCPKAKLGIELDGAAHDGPERQAYDAERTRHLEGVGVRVVRFENRVVWERPDDVLAAILDAARAPSR